MMFSKEWKPGGIRDYQGSALLKLQEARVFDQLKKDWKTLRENRPGNRFQARYRYREYHSPSSGVKRLLKIIIGITLIPVGILLWFVPGPGWLMIFIGLALLAGRSKTLSRFLDRAELLIRRILPGEK